MSASLNDMNAELGSHVERMISIQSQAYPDHWTSDEKRDSAIKHLFGTTGAFTHEVRLTDIHRISDTEIVA